MKTLGINDNNDICLDSSNNIVVKEDLAAMGDILINKSQTKSGELLFNNSKGIDFFNTIFSSPAYPDLFQNEVITQLENTEAVEKVSNFNAAINNNIYSYTVNVQTEYGEISLNG